MEITQEQKQQLINLNDSKVNEILGVDRLEVGKWYKGHVDFNSLICITSVGVKREYTKIGYYGFFNGRFEEDYFSNKSHESSLEIATHKEVKNALIKEAKRRYKCGDKVKSVSETYYNEVFEIDMKLFEFYIEDKDLWVSSKIEGCRVCIFNNGKWAEVVEQKPNKQEIINQINELLKQL